MIEVKHLTKKYGNHIAVDDLSFTIEEGQIYGFLGPNGAGKSTTMNMLTGYLGATAGEIRIDGHDIYKEPEEAKKNIGYLPELPPVYDAMTVMEYMKFVAQLKKLDKKEQQKQIEEVMELTQITSMKNRLIQNLSKGYKQRVGLAQAVLGYPPIIILDEPTVGLDPVQIIEIREMIKKLGREHTVILSSHILPEVSAVCDHIMIISKGKLVASDTTENLGQLMNGDHTLSLLLKAQEEQARESVQELVERHPAIMEWQVQTQKERELTQVTLHYAKEEDLREDVFYFYAKKQIPIYEMRLSSKTLEDVFLELTEEPDAGRKELPESEATPEEEAVAESEETEKEEE